MAIRDDLNQLDEDDMSELPDYTCWLAADRDKPHSPEELARMREDKAPLAAGHCVTL